MIGRGEGGGRGWQCSTLVIAVARSLFALFNSISYIYFLSTFLYVLYFTIKRTKNKSDNRKFSFKNKKGRMRLTLMYGLFAGWIFNISIIGLNWKRIIAAHHLCRYLLLPWRVDSPPCGHPPKRPHWSTRS